LRRSSSYSSSSSSSSSDDEPLEKQRSAERQLSSKRRIPSTATRHHVRSSSAGRESLHHVRNSGERRFSEGAVPRNTGHEPYRISGKRRSSEGAVPITTGHHPSPISGRRRASEPISVERDRVLCPSKGRVSQRSSEKDDPKFVPSTSSTSANPASWIADHDCFLPSAGGVSRHHARTCERRRSGENPRFAQLDMSRTAGPAPLAMSMAFGHERRRCGESGAPRAGDHGGTVGVAQDQARTSERRRISEGGARRTNDHVVQSPSPGEVPQPNARLSDMRRSSGNGSPSPHVSMRASAASWVRDVAFGHERQRCGESAASRTGEHGSTSGVAQDQASLSERRRSGETGKPDIVDHDREMSPNAGDKHPGTVDAALNLVRTLYHRF